jgi:hypothetical protein
MHDKGNSEIGIDVCTWDGLEVYEVYSLSTVTLEVEEEEYSLSLSRSHLFTRTRTGLFVVISLMYIDNENIF